MIDGTRRRLVKAVGGIATVGLLAGCAEDDENGEEEEEGGNGEEEEEGGNGEEEEEGGNGEEEEEGGDDD